MRTTTILTMLTSASMIAFLPVRSAEARFAAPGAARVAASVNAQITGLYNLTLVGVKTRAEQRVDLRLEQGLEGYSAVLLTDSQWVELEEVRLEGETLHARASTSAGRAELTLRVTLDGVSGTMRIGKHTITVKGERAS